MREKREPVLWKGEGFGRRDLRAAGLKIHLLVF
jgi:hypothetical protein